VKCSPLWYGHQQEGADSVIAALLDLDVCDIDHGHQVSPIAMAGDDDTGLGVWSLSAVLQGRQYQGRSDYLLLTLGVGCTYSIRAVVRYNNGYGNMFLYREDNSWQHWLHVSKYPPSAAFTFLELGVMSIIMAIMIWIERLIGDRPNGVLAGVWSNSDDVLPGTSIDPGRYSNLRWLASFL
jgi:hypothetical protein